ncbi:MAG: 1-acyl-sn-glycerol-3-phosphate acyltransferase [Bacteroidota bacterium]
MISSWLARKILQLLGWRIEGQLPSGVRKGVVVFAPHTSNWDAFYGLLILKAIRIPYRFAIKKEALFFPVGLVLKRLGAVPVARKKHGPQPSHAGTTPKVVALLRQTEDIFLVIAPEGTRKYAPKWRSGFYHIAQQAQVPILTVYIDYSRKLAGWGPAYHPPHKDFEKLVKELRTFYSTKQGRYPVAGVQDTAIQRVAK